MPEILKGKPRAIQFFEQVQMYLIEQKAHTATDYISIAMCAYWLDVFASHVAKVEEYGAVENVKFGTKMSGYFQVMMVAENNLTKWMRELGLTVKSREKIKAFMRKWDDPEENKDPMDTV